MCCCHNHKRHGEDWLIVEDGLGRVHLDTVDDESIMKREVVDIEQNAQNHRRQGSSQSPQHSDSSPELDDLSKPDGEDTQDRMYKTGCEFESDLDGVTDNSISELEEPFLSYDQEKGMKEDEKRKYHEEGVYQYQRRSFTQISLNFEILTVTGAGNAAVNGVYRWFAAHERFVMFSDQGQYQIMRGVNLSEYGIRYYDCWTIEEIKENVTRLYAVPSNESNSISSGGWICIDGALPAPIVQGEEEKERYCDDGQVETDESDASISPMPTPYYLKEWSVINNVDGAGTVQCVA